MRFVSADIYILAPCGVDILCDEIFNLYCSWNVRVRTVKLMNDQPCQFHSPEPGAAGEETNG